MDFTQIKKELKKFIEDLEMPKLFKYLEKYKKPFLIILFLFIAFKWLTEEKSDNY